LVSIIIEALIFAYSAEIWGRTEHTWHFSR